MSKDRMHGNLGFRLMSLGFWFRDRVRPPARILEEAGVRPDMTVLDFGCGSGGFSLAAARLVGPKGLVYAIDIHPLAVKTVLRTSEKQALTNLEAVLGSGTTDLPGEMVDVVLLYDVLHDLHEPFVILADHEET